MIFIKTPPSFKFSFAVLLMAGLLLSALAPESTAIRASDHWVASWGTAEQLVEPNNMPPTPGLTNNTIRQVVRVSIGGKSLRLRFSNEFSKSPVTIKSVHIAASIGSGDSGINPASIKYLKFNGKSDVTM